MNAQLTIHSPRPTGKYGITRVSETIVDYDRTDPSTGLPRKLALDVWLPTEQPIQLVPYDERALNYWRIANFWTEEQKSILSHELNTFGQYSKQIFLQSNDLLPAVIFSHGFGAWASFYSYIIEEIVSHKIAVIGINHTHQAGFAQFSNETIFGKMTHIDLFKSRYADKEQALMLQDLVSVIGKIGSNFPYALDQNNLVVMGHSLGGSTATHACTTIPQLRGCINLDGALFGSAPLIETLCPFLLLLGEESINSMHEDINNINLSNKLGISLEQAKDFKECYLSRLERICHKNRNVEKVILNGVDHIGFTDFAFLKQSKLFEKAPIGRNSSDEIICKIRELVLNFLQKILI